jgi:hypothetical protein
LIHIELESVYAPEALVRPTVKKWQRRFHQGRPDLFDSPSSGRLLTNNRARAIHFMLEEKPFSSCKVLCHHFRIGKATCLRILHDGLGLKFSIFVGCRIAYQSTRRAKECHIRRSFCRYGWNRRRAAFSGLSLEMSRDSSSIIPVIRPARRRAMSFINASRRELTRKSGRFRSFDWFTKPTVSLMYSKGRSTIQRSSPMLVCPV